MEYTLITGATGGLGREFCRQLVATDNLFLTGRSKEKLEDLRSELLKISPNAEIEIFPADVTSEDERKALFDYAIEKNAIFSGLMNAATNNAAIWHLQHILLLLNIIHQTRFHAYQNAMLNIRKIMNNQIGY